MKSYKTVDDWLGMQSVNVATSFERLKWSFIYLTDAMVEIFNHIQYKIWRNRSQVLSRILAALVVIVPLIVLWAI